MTGPIAAAGTAGDTSRLASNENLKAAGDKFEAVFTGMMLASMRKARLSETLFDSKAQDTFRDLSDQRLAQSMAEHAPIGIGRAMTEFLARSQPDLNRPTASTAG